MSLSVDNTRFSTISGDKSINFHLYTSAQPKIRRTAERNPTHRNPSDGAQIAKSQYLTPENHPKNRRKRGERPEKPANP